MDVCRRRGAQVTEVDLNVVPAAALLGRDTHDELDAAIRATLGASVVLAATPTYRNSYSGLLKCFFDLLPDDALRGKIGVPVVTGTSIDDLRVAAQGLSALFTALGAETVPGGAYATDADFVDDRPTDQVLKRVDRAVADALQIGSPSEPG